MDHLILSCLESRLEGNGSIYGRFLLGPFKVGQGITVANALRRTLLSEVQGIGITAVEIKGATHQYSSIAGIRESTLDIILNLKQIVFTGSVMAELPAVGYLTVQGPKKVRGSDLKLPNGICCINGNQYIATVASGGALTMKFVISAGKNQVVSHLSTVRTLTKSIFEPKIREKSVTPLTLRFATKSPINLGLRNKKSVTSQDVKFHKVILNSKGRPRLSSGETNKIVTYNKERRFLTCDPLTTPLKRGLGLDPLSPLPLTPFTFTSLTPYPFGTPFNPLVKGIRGKIKGVKRASKGELVVRGNEKGLLKKVLESKHISNSTIEEQTSSFSSASKRITLLPNFHTIPNTSNTFNPPGHYVAKGIKEETVLNWVQENILSQKDHTKDLVSTLSQSSDSALLHLPEQGGVFFSGLSRDQFIGSGKRKQLQEGGVFKVSTRETAHLPYDLAETEQIKSPRAERSPLPIDAVFVPVNKVNFSLQVDDQWQEPKERVILEVWTNGSVHPQQAIHEATTCLVYLFSQFRQAKIPSILDSINLPSHSLNWGQAPITFDIVNSQLRGKGERIERGLTSNEPPKESKQTNHATKAKSSSLAIQTEGYLIDIGNLNFSVQTYVALKQIGIDTIADFLTSSFASFYKEERISKQVYLEIKEIIRRFSLKEQFPELFNKNQ